MTDDLYERYKEALRVGHVAVLRGALEEAREAYRAAASVAPSRALPHTSLGGVLLRLGHLEDALTEYAAAVARAPHDEGALLGQAEALTMAGQNVDAAIALDHVSEVQEAAGRLPEAADTLRRAMELEDSAERGRRQRGLLRQIRLSAGDQAAEQLLARALRLRDEPAVSPVEPARAPVAATGEWPANDLVRPAMRVVEPDLPARVVAEPAVAWPAAAPESELPDEKPGVETESKAEAPLRDPDEAPMPGSAALSVLDPAREAGEMPGIDIPSSVAAAELSAEAAAEYHNADPDPAAAASQIAAVEVLGLVEGRLDAANVGVGESQHLPSGDELLVAAEAAEVSGDMTTLRSLLVWTARAYAREGRFEAGLDATHRLLARAPSDVDAHLVLVELYVARGWNALAIDKLALLWRLAELNDDTETRARLCAVAGRTFPKDERLLALCS